MICILLEASANSPIDPSIGIYPSLGIGGALAGLLFWFYRIDRQDALNRYASLTRDTAEKNAAVAADFRIIVQENTRAITALVTKLDDRYEHTVREWMGREGKGQ